MSDGLQVWPAVMLASLKVIVEGAVMVTVAPQEAAKDPEPTVSPPERVTTALTAARGASFGLWTLISRSLEPPTRIGLERNVRVRVGGPMTTAWARPGPRTAPASVAARAVDSAAEMTPTRMRRCDERSLETPRLAMIPPRDRRADDRTLSR